MKACQRDAVYPHIHQRGCASDHPGSASLVAVSFARAPRGRDVLKGVSKNLTHLHDFLPFKTSSAAGSVRIRNYECVGCGICLKNSAARCCISACVRFSFRVAIHQV